MDQTDQGGGQRHTAASVTDIAARWPSVAPHLAVVRTGAPDSSMWAACLVKSITAEIRVGVTDGLLTTAEADQLLARLALVVDQAVSPAEPR